MTWNSIVAPLILGTLIPGCSPTRALYHSKIREERLAHRPNPAPVLGEAELPEPVRRYLELTGPGGQFHFYPSTCDAGAARSSIEGAVEDPGRRIGPT